ncbi:hypothetical protein NQ317_008976 [Molorchus minor]|uniref:Uncharacterized protein n=1 Tax=Molorchus minor TaxID=1323400 RepID=A0ABQ9JA47_9CUCU|nr:hypothetical protein NQ317_008976 [Molorchus minor]
MELRSSRSRSKTPFTQVESFDKELIERGNHVERTVTRVTRRSTTMRTNDNTASSTDEVTSYNVKPSRRSTRSENTAHKLYKTSDYSSEDGENEVSSTRTISQNEKNQLIEDARAAANGSSECVSKDRLDIFVPLKRSCRTCAGVIAMPNMSRKTIHSVHESDSHTDYVNKETNTESLLSNSFTANTEYSTSKSKSDYKSRYSNTDLYGASRKLFNNNYDSDYELYEKRVTLTAGGQSLRNLWSVYSLRF